MNNSLLVLSVYSRGHKAANDDGLSAAEQSSAKTRRIDEEQADGASGWDPYEVWRSRVRGRLSLDD